MPYTLMKGLLWVLLALLLGIVVGWMLRNVTVRREVARARGQATDSAELERLRGRIANLEPVVTERDRLRAELEECRTAASSAEGGAAGFAGVGASAPATAGAGTEAAGDSIIDVTPPPAPDVGAATEVIGAVIVLDDLKVVEGIGPRIEQLCHGIGIRTWFDLSTTEVSLLRTMLADAGPRFRTHDPSTWPRQAGLLAEGRWQEFKSLTDELQGGRNAD